MAHLHGPRHPSTWRLKPDGTPYTVFTPFSKRWHLNLTSNMAQAPSEAHLNQLLSRTSEASPRWTRWGSGEPSLHLKPWCRQTLVEYADMETSLP